MLSTYPSEIAQNFWTTIYAWTICFVVTILVSLATRARPDKEMVGLVYSLTERPKREETAWYRRPVVLGVVVLGLALVFNIIFW